MGENLLKLINFYQYNQEEIIFRLTRYKNNNTYQNLNSELIGMLQSGILSTLTNKQVQGSLPPNYEKLVKTKRWSFISSNF